MGTLIESTGFYAVFNGADPFREIRDVGYKPGKTIYPGAGPGVFPVVVQPAETEVWKHTPDPVTGVPVKDEPEVRIRTDFEAFLRTLYGAQCELVGAGTGFDLFDQMKAAGVLEQCGSVQIVDFMALTGAIATQQTLPDGTQVNCTTLGPGDVRPLISTLKRQDDSLMWSIIDFLGLQGMIPYLYASEAIGFPTLCARLKSWIPNVDERSAYIVSILRPALRSKGTPVFTPQQRIELLS